MAKRLKSILEIVIPVTRIAPSLLPQTPINLLSFITPTRIKHPTLTEKKKKLQPIPPKTTTKTPKVPKLQARVLLLVVPTKLL